MVYNVDSFRQMPSTLCSCKVSYAITLYTWNAMQLNLYDDINNSSDV